MAVIAIAIVIIIIAMAASCKESCAHRGHSRVSRTAHGMQRLLLGTLLGVFLSRANENRTEEEI